MQVLTHAPNQYMPTTKPKSSFDYNNLVNVAGGIFGSIFGKKETPQAGMDNTMKTSQLYFFLSSSCWYVS
jgi:hypothetical protein